MKQYFLVAELGSSPSEHKSQTPTEKHFIFDLSVYKYAAFLSQLFRSADSEEIHIKHCRLTPMINTSETV